MGDEWLKGYTLSRKKPFLWYYDREKIIIKREFKNNYKRQDEFYNYQIDMIIQYIAANDKVYLSNNVDTVRKGTEKDGIGKYIYENIKKDLYFQQSSSQLVSILYNANILFYNIEKNNMKFWIKDLNWKRKIVDFIETSNRD